MSCRSPSWSKRVAAAGGVAGEAAGYAHAGELSEAALKRLEPEFGAIGVKLEGDSQLLLRTRSGGPMLYYRTKF